MDCCFWLDQQWRVNKLCTRSSGGSIVESMKSNGFPFPLHLRIIVPLQPTNTESCCIRFSLSKTLARKCFVRTAKSFAEWPISLDTSHIPLFQRMSASAMQTVSGRVICQCPNKSNITNKKQQIIRIHCGCLRTATNFARKPIEKTRTLSPVHHVKVFKPA